MKVTNHERHTAETISEKKKKSNLALGISYFSLFLFDIFLINMLDYVL